MTITLQYFDGCPNWEIAATRLRNVVDRLGLDTDIDLQLVDSPDAADRLGFRGSPTVLIDGLDPFADPLAPVGLSCRIYDTEDGRAGAPSEQQLERVLQPLS